MITYASPADEATVNAAPDQVAQCAAAIALFSGNVTRRLYAADGTTLLRTLTYGPFTVGGTSPKKLVPGTKLADTHVATGAAAFIAECNGATEKWRGPITLTYSVKDLWPVDLAAVDLWTANAALPIGGAGIPYSVFIDDWSSGSAVPAGSITLAQPLGSASFADATLAAQCPTWQEYGPTETRASLPVVGGIRFSAHLKTIPAGGAYSTTLHQVVVMCFADDLREGIFGSVISPSIRTKPPAFKMRCLDASGTLLHTEQMPAALGGGPVNNAANQQDVRVSSSDVIYPHVTAATSYVFTIGTPPAPPLLSWLPRADSTSDTLYKTTKRRGATNGANSEWFIRDTTDNGVAHPLAIPDYPLSALAAASATIGTSDAEVVGAGSAGNWAGALTVGALYYPGNPGGNDWRTGRGGITGTKTLMPPEPFGQYIRTPAGTRSTDGKSYATYAAAWIKNQFNRPCYRPANYSTLQSLDPITKAFPIGAGEQARVWHHYYGDPTNTGGTSGIEVCDGYGTGKPWGEIGSRTSHPWSGWGPDSEHSYHGTLGYAALGYANPVYSLLYEHHVAETLIMCRSMAGISGRPFVDVSVPTDPAELFGARSVMTEFCHLALAWKVATTSSTFTRAKIETRLRAWMAGWVDAWASVPATATTAGQEGWNKGLRWPVYWHVPDATGSETFTGWNMGIGLGGIYLVDALMLYRHYGLETVLRTGGSGTENTKCSAFFDAATLASRQLAEMFSSKPWGWVPDEISGITQAIHPYLPLRTVVQGAVQATISTIPNYASALTNAGTNPRGDNKWWLRPDGTPRIQANATDFWRMKCAFNHWRYLEPAGATRTAALSALATWRAAMETDILAAAPAARADAIPGATLFYFACPQSLPAIEAF
jgi:hypothetical protein